MLIDKEIRQWIIQEKMIQNYVDLDVQLQANGFDLTLKNVMMFTDEWEPRIDFDNKNRLVSSARLIFPEANEYHLEQGIYLFRANEIFKTPDNIVGWGMPRSTLSRCGIVLNSAVLDAGYLGHLVFVVYIPRAIIFSKDARFVQMIFFKLNEAPDRLYQGVYNEFKKTIKPKKYVM